MDNQIITTMPVSVYGQLTPYNQLWSKARCRIFYKGANRNGSFITDEFAEKLIASLPYTPVKGIYDEELQDFTDHGEERDEGRIYGIVPADPDVRWEEQEDEDGVTRTYATAQVMICTGIYQEASKIVGKPQSMELYRSSLKGEWKKIDGKQYYVFTDGCFGGLQVLGDEVEPCFEGAAFYSLFTALKDLMDNATAFTKGTGGTPMPVINFKLSDNAKYEKIWAYLNPNYGVNDNWECEYAICDVYDEYAVVYSYADKYYERLYYNKNEDDTIEFGCKKRCYIIDVDEAELNALQALHALNGDTYAAIDVNYNALQTKNSELELGISEKEEAMATLNTEKTEIANQLNDANDKLAEANTQYSAIQEQLATVSAERDELASYKKTTETARKMDIINSYADQLGEDSLKPFIDNIDNYTDRALDMELTYALKNVHPEAFTKTPSVVVIPKDEPQTGITSILAKYEKH